ncbi:MAG TPA: FAD-dependent oxidoreductase [Streptosporangiaceae bacterium]
MRQPTSGPERPGETGSSARSPAESSGRSARQAQAGRSPVLDPAQLGVLRRYGREHDMAAGDVLFAAGDVTYDLIVVLAGEVRIVERHGQPGETVIATYGPSQFLGEIGLLTGQRAYLSAVATTAGRVLRVPVEQVRVIMAQELGLSELILRTFLLRHSILTGRGTGLTLIGSRFDAGTRRLLEVLARNRLASRWLELEGSPEAEAMLRELNVPVGDLPIVVVPGRPLLRNPGRRELLDALGLSGLSDTDLPGVCDLLVVGAGPGGLAAAVYGASEGMATVLAEDTALGGQAGTSSRIENYLGFPAGLSGEELAARAALQAQKFGVRIKLAAKAVSLSSDSGVHQVSFDDGEAITAKSVIIATGARYNRLPLDRLAEFEGVGVYYAATQMEAQACRSDPVAIVGGGNSAGQAALFLSRSSAEVHVIIRGQTLETSMSRYLIDQIERNHRIGVTPRTQVTALLGKDQLEGVELLDTSRQQTSALAVRGLFVFIGAQPSTQWLAGQLAEDTHGFLLTGTNIPEAQLDDKDRIPLFLETSRPGVFAVGDVRSGSVKRAATAIGEGSMAVRLVFERLQATGSAVADPPRADGDRRSAAATPGRKVTNQMARGRHVD